MTAAAHRSLPDFCSFPCDHFERVACSASLKRREAGPAIMGESSQLRQKVLDRGNGMAALFGAPLQQALTSLAT